MQAVDTNILVFSVIRTAPQHERARTIVRDFAEGAAAWAIPWPCAYEFLRVVTHPRVYHPPMPIEMALADIGSILASPSLVMLSETARHGAMMEEIIRASRVTGNLVHDAHIAALCMEHGVSALLTGDRDFHRFRDLRVIDPFS
jgi:toxin-antitoxin system PIN domain toxin